MGYVVHMGILGSAIDTLEAPERPPLTGSDDGNLWRFDSNGAAELLGNTGGRPLGVEMLSGGRYLTDSSDLFEIEEHRHEILEHRATGRSLRLDLNTGETDLLADSRYANGVGLALDESFAAARVSIWYENLPGIPDNIASQTADGIFWLALHSPRMRLLNWVAPHPFVRRVIADMAEVPQPDPAERGWVLGIDRNANMVHSLEGSNGSYAPIADVREADGWLYLGRLGADGIAQVAASARDAG